MIGREEIFTNGAGIVSITIYKNEGIGACAFSGQYEEVFCSYRLALEINNASAEKQAQITSSLGTINESGISYLSENLTLYLDGKKLDDIRISSELKGTVNNYIQISGFGSGKDRKKAIDDAKKKHEALANIFLDIK
ncbi:MAG TPA: hypothetical protein VFF28_05915 [Candidatus Nanoarchaeia archaeon]|nr:hypothetical protein [Candidatus Nanoarchaeia archaeon]